MLQQVLFQPDNNYIFSDIIKFPVIDLDLIVTKYAQQIFKDNTNLSVDFPDSILIVLQLILIYIRTKWHQIGSTS